MDRKVSLLLRSVSGLKRRLLWTKQVSHGRGEVDRKKKQVESYGVISNI